MRTDSGNSSRGGQQSTKASGLTLSRQSSEDVGSPDLIKNRVRWTSEDDASEGSVLLKVEGRNEGPCGECLCPPAPPSIHGSCAISAEETASSESSDSAEQSSLNFFYMSNRARLPKGIENIRPHLENVDNVPLLVSLFTDCMQPTTKTMIAIMQEYTEVAIIMGSSANAENMPLFLQADMSIGVDPLHPQVCMKEPVFIKPSPDKGPTPMELASRLNSIPCSFSFHREDSISLVHLIMEARHYMQHLMGCFQFWVCCCISVSLLQLLGQCAVLPPLLSTGKILWLVSVPVPILSSGLIFAPTDPAVMSQATGKNSVTVNRELISHIMSYYASKFAPSLLVVLLWAILTLRRFCEITSVETGAKGCVYVYPQYPAGPSVREWGGWGDRFPLTLNNVQSCVAFLLVFYFCVISVSFVHRLYQLWWRHPFMNRFWSAAVFIVLLLQCAFTACSLSSEGIPQQVTNSSIVPETLLVANPHSIFIPSGHANEHRLESQHTVVLGIHHMPLWSWMVAFIWPVILVPLNELIKRREIRANGRYQKRARLEFGTKLGMNSPF